MKKKHFPRLRSKKAFFSLALIALISAIWLIIRTGKKPSRINYPCQRAAAANINLFLIALIAPLIGLTKKILPKQILKNKTTKILTIAGLTIGIATSTFTILSNNPAQTINYAPVALNLQSQMATSNPISNLFIIQNASGPKGNLDLAISTLFASMANNDLNIYKTSSTPTGFIAKDDVIILKVNAQSPQRGNTNSDLTKSLIKTLIAHPEGFSGEIVIADNGQGSGRLDLTENNAYNTSQSMTNIASMFPLHKVSTYSWWPIASNNVNEYSQGNYQDGYVVNSTSNSITNLKVSYPKFQTAYGTYISFKYGVWNQSTQTYNSPKLKVINLPLFKSHYQYGATACVKNYMGVVSQSLTGAHETVGLGGMGTAIIETRFPILNIIDCIWINANPFQPGDSLYGSCGPFTSYEEASYTNIIGASTDPIALEYWIAKNVAIPTATQNGYTYTSSIDPDYQPITENLAQSYHNYLNYSMNQIKNNLKQTTMQENQMNIYIANLTPTPTSTPTLAPSPTSTPIPMTSPTPIPTPITTPTPTPTTNPTPTSTPAVTPTPESKPEQIPSEYLIIGGIAAFMFVAIGIFILSKK